MLAAPHPVPVYAQDTALADLHTAEVFVVSVLRLWVDSLSVPEDKTPRWRGGFAAAGIDEQAAPAFDMLLRIVAATGLRTFDVRHCNCRKLGSDEAQFLQILSLLQRGDHCAAEQLLSGWLPPASLRLALLPALRLGLALSSAKLTIPQRHSEAATLYAAAPAVRANRGLALVH